MVKLRRAATGVRGVAVWTETPVVARDDSTIPRRQSENTPVPLTSASDSTTSPECGAHSDAHAHTGHVGGAGRATFGRAGGAEIESVGRPAEGATRDALAAPAAIHTPGPPAADRPPSLLANVLWRV